MSPSTCQHVGDAGVACTRAQAAEGLCLGHLNAPRVRALPTRVERAPWQREDYGPTRVRRLQRA